jgi:hypothetical protein
MLLFMSYIIEPFTNNCDLTYCHFLSHPLCHVFKLWFVHNKENDTFDDFQRSEGLAVPVTNPTDICTISLHAGAGILELTHMVCLVRIGSNT